MKFGLLFELQNPKPWHKRKEYELFHQAADQTVWAEQQGFEYVWAVEHHFTEEFAHSTAPDAWLGNLSARTSVMRLGFGVVLLPGAVNHPIRVAERVATLDIVSDGRVEFGTGRSTGPFQIEPFGADAATSREEWEEAVHLIPKLWKDEWVGHEGRFWRFSERNVIPKPIQEPHPPIWVAAVQPDSFALAGRKGIGCLCFTVGAPGELEERIRTYRQAIQAPTEQVGDSKNEQVAAFTIAYCDEDGRKAREIGGPAGAYYFDAVRKIYDYNWQGKSEEEIPPSYRYHAIQRTTREKTFDSADYTPLIENGSFCVGDPDNCIMAIEMYEAAGVDQVMLLFQAGRTPHEGIMNSIRLYGKYVIPHFKEKEKRSRPRASTGPEARGAARA
jgi:alkanesulfonate monooxygenase SsuD/methylene tetrahydromethanopterin reductase-like flavin-dependent oxidoreductase (luciferase family)